MGGSRFQASVFVISDEDVSHQRISPLCSFYVLTGLKNCQTPLFIFFILGIDFYFYGVYKGDRLLDFQTTNSPLS